MSRSGLEQVKQQAGSYELRTIDVITDGLAEKYTDLAKADASVKEAATLFAAAEVELERGNGTSEVVDKACDALRRFRIKKNADGVRDSVRLVVHAHRAKAEALVWAGDLNGKADQALKKARVLVNEELELSQENNNERSEAAMLLSLAELSVLDGEVAKKGANDNRAEVLKEAEGHAQAAVSKFEKASDSKMQVLAMLVLCRLRCTIASLGRGSFQTALDDAKKATEVAQQAKDSRGEALAKLHSISVQLDDGKVKEAFDTIIQNKVPEVIGAKKFHAGVLCKLSQHKLFDATQVLKIAKDAYGIFRELKYGKGYEAASLGAMVDSLIESGQLQKAKQTAEDGVKELKARDVKESGRAMHHLVHAMVANGEEQEAMKLAEEAVEVNCQDLADAHSSVVLQLSCAQIYLKGSKYRQAADALSRAEEGLEDLDNSEGSQLLAKFIEGLQYKIREKDEEERRVRAEKEAARIQAAAERQWASDQNKKANKRDPDEPLADYDPAEVGDFQGGDVLKHAQSFLESYEDHMKNGRIDEALKAATIAVDLYYDNDEQSGEAHALLGVSACHIANQNIRPGMFAAKSSLENFRELDDKAGAAEALHALATLNNLSGHTKEALVNSHEALGIYLSEAPSGHGALKMYFSIIDSYQMELEKVSVSDRQTKEKHKNTCEKALNSAKKAAKLAMDCDELTEGCAQHYLATAYNLNGKTKEAIQACEEARVLFARGNEGGGQVQALTMMADSLLLLKKQERAKNVLNEAMGIAYNAGMMDECAPIQAELDKIAEAEAAAQVRMVAMPLDFDPNAPMNYYQGGEGGGGGGGAAPAAASAAPVEEVALYKPPAMEDVAERIGLIAKDMTGDDEFDADTPFMDAGIDSLASVELRTTLQKAFGVSLPSTVMFNYPTRASIAGFIVEEMVENEVALK